jgi:hypothetical protein
MKYPYISSEQSLNKALREGDKIISQAIGRFNKIRMDNIALKAVRGDNSLKANSKNGTLVKKRATLHQDILKRQFRDRGSIDRKDPDLYIFGGLPASGKTYILQPKIKEKTTVIDSDAYKTELAKKSQSPFRKYPLAHAPYLQEEAGLIIKQAVNKAIKEKRNVIYDTTFRDYRKAKKFINKFKEAGYDIHYLGTQRKPTIAIRDASKRFLINGRYVPLVYLKENANAISKGSWRARKLGDTYQVFDTNNINNPKLISKSRKPITFNFRDP